MTHNACACGNCFHVEDVMNMPLQCRRRSQDVEPLMSCSLFLPPELRVLLPLCKKLTPEELWDLIGPIVGNIYGQLPREAATITAWRDELLWVSRKNQVG